MSDDFKSLIDKNETSEEKMDFQEIMGDVKKINHNKAMPFRKKRRPVPLNIPIEDTEEARYIDMDISITDILSYQSAGIQNRVFKDLGSGYIKPEGTLDLHGMRVVEAKKILQRFLNDALDNHARCVRIIHGKGRGSADNQPILKQKTNQWLRQRIEVLAFISAPTWDGGTGVVYVLLSKKGRQD